MSVNLFVTPRINGDDSITLQGGVSFGDVTGSITNPNGGTLPITIQQPVTINRIVRNGDSMVIAGLTRKRDNVSTNKVPLLGDLPLIGTLFRSRNVTTDDSELVVFITPTIIPDRPSGNTAGSGVGSGSGVGGAGADFRRWRRPDAVRRRPQPAQTQRSRRGSFLPRRCFHAPRFALHALR